MTNPAAGEGSDYNTQIINEFRANGGRVGGPWAGTTLILIHHIGARSRAERVTPLGCFSQPGGRFVIVASSGGSPTQPNWYYNLKAHPKITVEVGAQTFTVLADELAGAARTVGEHQARTARQFPVFLLTRRTEPRQQPPASRRRGACISGSWQRH
jgi:deazaflavin-dependent oxidoreductase (nitroreductase family)